MLSVSAVQKPGAGRPASVAARGRLWRGAFSCARSRLAKSASLQSCSAADSEGSSAASAAGAGDSDEDFVPGPIPTLLNTIPHARITRQYFYKDTRAAVQKALAAGQTRVTARCVIPETNTDFDVYRIGTLLELVRELATSLAADGKRVKVCVQQSLGQGVFQGTPLSLNGVMRIMKMMDWGPNAELIQTGNLGAAEVDSADAFVLISPQNIVGHSIIPLLTEMTEAAEAAGKPMILLNPKLTDIQSAGGVMSVRGRQQRLDFVATFTPAYHFRLLYRGPNMHPIMGALRYMYGSPWEVYQRKQLGPGQEEYRLIGSFEQEPSSSQITQAFERAWSKHDYI